MTIDKQTAQQLSREVEDALREVAERHGLKVEVRGGTFDAGLFRPKVEFKTDDADKVEFGRYAAAFDLSPDDFGAKFVSQGRTFRVSGVAPRSPKRPILATEVATGRVFKFAEDSVKALLAAAKAVA